MSANVWFEEVNTGLIAELKRTVKIKNQQGSLVTLPDNAFTIRKPEKEFMFETLPCVSIYNKDYKHDALRYVDNQPVKRSVNNGIATVEDIAVPFNLTYQIDFWSNFQSDMDVMTRTWLSTHFRQFNLDVIDDGGNNRSCNVLMQGKIVKSDLIQGSDRIFHSILNYLIWVEIDDEIQYNVNTVNKINITAKGR